MDRFRFVYSKKWRGRRWSWLFSAYPTRGAIEIGWNFWLLWDDDVPRWKINKTLGGHFALYLIWYMVEFDFGPRRTDLPS